LTISTDFNVRVGFAGEDKMLFHSVGHVRLVSVAAFIVFWLGATVPIAVSAGASEPPSVAKGYELAEKFCKACHIIDDKPSSVTPVGPPSFADIANKPGQTAERIKGTLIQPHPPMPDMHLTNEEILNIVAYLETLRTDETIPPFLPPAGEAKPKYPWPG
jgi:mono/diheme cytochrome c family protein